MPADLAQSIRVWRERLDPSEAGYSRAVTRHTPGLRREEVAAEAGISVNYLTRLEQGRAQAPSQSVVAALARALRLDAPEVGHLHRLAGYAEPTSPVADRHITPSIQRFLERLEDVPVIVVDAAWTILAANRMASAFFNGEVVGENAARRQFIGPAWVEQERDQEDQYERDLVGDLHGQLARHPRDRTLRAIVGELRCESERFDLLWAERPAGFPSTTRKTFNHPVAGRFTVDCDLFSVADGDLRMVVWTAVPGSDDDRALDQMRRTSVAGVGPGGSATFVRSTA